MNNVVVSVWRNAIFERLAYLDRLAAHADLASAARLAQTEMIRLTESWRSLLAEHDPDEDGACPTCSGWRRRKRFPCSVWKAAHLYLTNGHGPTRRGRAGE